ncbi:MAG: 4Fe-4S binding protein [Promethearchaeota archaeon]
MADEYIFFSPIMVEPEKCGSCRACKAACPVHAIDIKVTGATVDREACLKVVQSQDGECFECLLVCRYNVLKLVKFKKTSSGDIERLE